MFTPDPQPSSRHTLDNLWPSRSEIIARGMVGGGGAVFVFLLFVGLIYLFIVTVFSFFAAIAGIIGVLLVSRPLKLEAEYAEGGLFVALGLGFLAFNAVTLVLDIAFDTWLSVPGMLALLGEPACRAPCMLGFQLDENGMQRYMLINNIGDFYTHTIGKEGAGPLRYLLHATPGVLALSYVMGFALPELRRSVGGLLRLFAAGWVALAAALVAAFPLMLLIVLGLRNWLRTV